MGNVSSTVQRAVTEIQNSAKSSCSNQVGIKQDLSVMLDLTDTNCPNLVFGNTAKSVSTCNMGAMADSLAAASVNLSKEQTAGLGLGLNVSSSVLERKTAIQNYLEQKCGNLAAIEQTNSVKIKANNLKCDQLSAFNNADATQQCAISAVVQAVDKQSASEAVKQKTDILGSLTALLASGPLLILGAVLLGFGLLYLVMRVVFKGGSQTAGATEGAAEEVSAGQEDVTPVADGAAETVEGSDATATTAAAGAQVSKNMMKKFNMLNQGMSAALKHADEVLSKYRRNKQ